MANELNVGDMKKALTEVVTDPKSRKVYEVGKPYNEGWLKVSALHEIHFFEMGKQDGKPVIYLWVSAINQTHNSTLKDKYLSISLLLFLSWTAASAFRYADNVHPSNTIIQ